MWRQLDKAPTSPVDGCKKTPAYAAARAARKSSELLLARGVTNAVYNNDLTALM
jgi:hypothetical protein